MTAAVLDPFGGRVATIRICGVVAIATTVAAAASFVAVTAAVQALHLCVVIRVREENRRRYRAALAGLGNPENKIKDND